MCTPPLLQDEFEADPEGASCVAWNPSRFDTPMLLVGGCSKANNLHVWGYNEDFHKWEVMKELKGHDGVIHDVAWAANVGRSAAAGAPQCAASTPYSSSANSATILLHILQILPLAGVGLQGWDTAYLEAHAGLHTRRAQGGCTASNEGTQLGGEWMHVVGVFAYVPVLAESHPPLSPGVASAMERDRICASFVWR